MLSKIGNILGISTVVMVLVLLFVCFSGLGILALYEEMEVQVVKSGKNIVVNAPDYNFIAKGDTVQVEISVLGSWEVDQNVVDLVDDPGEMKYVAVVLQREYAYAPVKWIASP